MSATISEKCVCCGGVTAFAFKAQPLDYCLDKEFSIYRCENCHHGITANVSKTDLESVYEGGAYDPKENVFHRAFRPFLNLLERTKLDYLTGGKGKTVLEVGAGKGNFLRLAISAGYDGFGIEPSNRSYKIAVEKLGNRILQCTLEDIHSYPQLMRKYDYIILWHVFEHLDDPEQACKMLVPFLAPEGRLVIAVPNFDSFQSRWGRKNWYHLDPPRHLSHFTPMSIGELLGKVGMKVNVVRHDSFFQDLLGEIITFNNMLLPHKNIVLNLLRFNGFYFARTHFVSRAMFLTATTFITVLLVLPALVWTKIGQWAKRSGTMVVIASSEVES